MMIIIFSAAPHGRRRDERGGTLHKPYAAEALKPCTPSPPTKSFPTKSP